MVLTCIFAVQVLALQEIKQVEVPLRYRRPSRIIEILERSPSKPPNSIEADDIKGFVRITGSSSYIRGIQDLVKLCDLQRQKLSVKVSIDSDIDKQSYDVTTKIYDQQKWKTGDGDTGITLAVEPRLNQDNSVTIMTDLTSPGFPDIRWVYRARLGTSQTFVVDGLSHQIIPQSNSTARTPATSNGGPRVTIRVGS